MAYRRKLTALFISAAFVLTLSLSFFFIAEELSHDHGHGGDPCPICEKIDLCLRTLSVCSSVTFPADNGNMTRSEESIMLMTSYRFSSLR